MQKPDKSKVIRHHRASNEILTYLIGATFLATCALPCPSIAGVSTIRFVDGQSETVITVMDRDRDGREEAIGTAFGKSTVFTFDRDQDGKADEVRVTQAPYEITFLSPHENRFQTALMIKHEEHGQLEAALALSSNRQTYEVTRLIYRPYRTFFSMDVHDSERRNTKQLICSMLEARSLGSTSFTDAASKIEVEMFAADPLVQSSIGPSCSSQKGIISKGIARTLKTSVQPQKPSGFQCMAGFDALPELQADANDLTFQLLSGIAGGQPPKLAVECKKVVGSDEEEAFGQLEETQNGSVISLNPHTAFKARSPNEPLEVAETILHEALHSKGWEPEYFVKAVTSCCLKENSSDCRILRNGGVPDQLQAIPSIARLLKALNAKERVKLADKILNAIKNARSELNCSSEAPLSKTCADRTTEWISELFKIVSNFCAVTARPACEAYTSNADKDKATIESRCATSPGKGCLVHPAYEQPLGFKPDNRLVGANTTFENLQVKLAANQGTEPAEDVPVVNGPGQSSPPGNQPPVVLQPPVSSVPAIGGVQTVDMTYQPAKAQNREQVRALVTSHHEVMREAVELAKSTLDKVDLSVIPRAQAATVSSPAAREYKSSRGNATNGPRQVQLSSGGGIVGLQTAFTAPNVVVTEQSSNDSVPSPAAQSTEARSVSSQSSSGTLSRSQIGQEHNTNDTSPTTSAQATSEASSSSGAMAFSGASSSQLTGGRGRSIASINESGPRKRKSPAELRKLIGSIRTEKDALNLLKTAAAPKALLNDKAYLKRLEALRIQIVDGNTAYGAKAPRKKWNLKLIIGESESQ